MFKKTLLLVTLFALIVSGCVAATPTATTTDGTTPAATTQELILATTTSTADSGLLDAILPDFEAKHNATVSVIAVGTGQALELGRNGDADVLLVHARSQEDQFVADGHARERFDVMYNDFIIVGPTDDPAGVQGMALGREAFQAIMDAEAPFASRGDNSGTHTKELSIWRSITITPTQEMTWYNSLGQGMGDTLLFANEQGAYTLTDRGTYLAMRDRLPNLTILVGGENLAENADSALLNPYGVMAVNPDTHPGVKFDLAMQFVEWIIARDTQIVIGNYGVEEFGQPLFYPSSEEYKATLDVTVIVGDTSRTFTLEELQAMPKVTLENYEATGHKKGPLGANTWAGASLKDVLLAVDPTLADEANAGKWIIATASDGWISTIRWNQVFGTPKGGEQLSDSYGCSECHGYMGEGTAPAGRRATPALAGVGWTFEATEAIVRAGGDAHGGLLPFTEEQLPDDELQAIVDWLQDPTAPITGDAFTVPAEKMVTLLAYEKNGAPANGRDGLIQMIMGMDKYTSRYAHWVQTIEVK